jgi:hypothetical protein
LKRIASLPGLQEKRTARVLFDLLAQTLHNILEQNLIATAISTPNRFDFIIQFYGCITVFIPSLDFPLYTLCLKKFSRGLTC